ncbi:MAG: YceI family protein [bacterium]|nr:YceI family protein [bacterium]MDE0288215.1 YceI family protein [bacterium]MDE0439979.1 YceI family protein [bacterium]
MRRRTKVIVGLAGVILVMGVSGIVWWILRAEGPAAVDLEAAVARMETAPGDDSGGSSVSESDDGTEEAAPARETPTTTPTSPAVSSIASTATATEDTSTTTSLTVSSTTSTATATEDSTSQTISPSTAPPVTAATGDVPAGSSTTVTTPPANAETTGLAGVWTVLTTEGADGLSEDAAISFAGYRVVEVLAGGVDESTAVGRTATVSGWIELRGNALVAANVEVEMATLRTDDSHRDSHARQSLNTKEFPLATFTLVEPLELPPGIFEGVRFAGSAEGDLTIKGVTNRAVFDLEAQLVGDVIVVVGSTEVVFSDYGVTAPTSRAVISVEDHGVMEFQLFLTR